MIPLHLSPEKEKNRMANNPHNSKQQFPTVIKKLKSNMHNKNPTKDNQRKKNGSPSLTIVPRS
jgi:predicted RNA-binding protein with RPS1 domain